MDPRFGLISASVMYRAEKCPGNHALITSLRELNRHYEFADPIAASGTRIHASLAGDKAIELTESEGETVIRCHELRGQLIGEWLGGEYPLENTDRFEFLIEQRLYYRRRLKPLFSGQLDFAIIDHESNTALIVDYKTGRRESVRADDNIQLRTQVVLLKHERPELITIDAAIIEPWVSSELMRVSYSGKTFEQAEEQICGIVDRADREPDTRIAGTWCEYCDAKAYCTEARRWIETIPMPHPEVMIAELPRGEKGVELWEKIRVAEKLLAALKDAYEKILLDEPGALPGYTLPERGRKRSMVMFPEILKHELRQVMTEKEIDGCATFHVDQIAELLAVKLSISKQKAKLKIENSAAGAFVESYDRPYIRPLRKDERAKRLIDQEI